MNHTKKYIGINLIRERNKLKMSQEQVASAAGMSQGNYSKLESNHQGASDEQIHVFSKILGISPQILEHGEPVVINGHIENQTGGTSQSYVIQNGFDPEVINACKSENAVLKSQISALEEIIGLLKMRIQDLEKRLGQ